MISRGAFQPHSSCLILCVCLVYTILGFSFWPLLEMAYRVASMFSLPRYGGSEKKLCVQIIFPFNLCNSRSEVNIQWLLQLKQLSCVPRLQHQTRKVVYRQKGTGSSSCERNEPAMTPDSQTSHCLGCRLNVCTSCLEQSNHVSFFSRVE